MQSHADPLPTTGQAGKLGGGEQVDRGQGSGMEVSGWPLLCLSRELLGGRQAWPLLLASCLVPGVLQLASLPLLPESPRYLLIDRGDTEACLEGESRTSGP